MLSFRKLLALHDQICVRKFTCGQKLFREQLSVDHKESYFKNLDNEQIEDDSKPMGWDEAKPFEEIPGPKPLPLFGNNHKFLPPFGEFYKCDFYNMHLKMNKKYGKIIAIRGLVGRNTVWLYCPKYIEIMFRSEGVRPIRDAIKTVRYYREVLRKDIFQGVGGAIVTLGEDWYQFRSKVNPILMQPRAVQQYIKNMDEVAQDFISRMRHLVSLDTNAEMPEDFLNELNKWALESVGIAAFDRRFGCLEHDLNPDSDGQKMINNSVGIFNLIYKLEMSLPLWRWFSTKDWKQFVTSMDFLTFTTLKYVDEAMEQIKKEPLNKPEYEMSVFQRLLKIDKKIAFAMATDMLLAGIDTTSRTTAAILYFLATNQEVQKKLQEELFGIIENKNTPITKEMLSNAPYLKAVIKETGRLAPIGIGNLRKSVKNMVIGGYQIPKGTEVVASQLVISRSEEYFPRPDDFFPDRWLRNAESDISHKNTHPFVSLPFGFGPRSCLGKRLALVEMEIVVAKILRNFKLTWHQKDMRFKTGLFYGVADPVKIRIQEVKN